MCSNNRKSPVRFGWIRLCTSPPNLFRLGPGWMGSGFAGYLFCRLLVARLPRLVQLGLVSVLAVRLPRLVRLQRLVWLAS